MVQADFVQADSYICSSSWAAVSRAAQPGATVYRRAELGKSL